MPDKNALPRLLTTRQFGAKIGRHAEWIRDACKDGRIPAAQKVGGNWIVPADALIRPRYTDLDLPQEFAMKGPPLPEPEYNTNPGNPNADAWNRRRVRALGYSKLRRELGLTQKDVYTLTGVSRDTQRKAELGLPVSGRTLVKLANGLDVDYSRLLSPPLR